MHAMGSVDMVHTQWSLFNVNPTRHGIQIFPNGISPSRPGVFTSLATLIRRLVSPPISAAVESTLT